MKRAGRLSLLVMAGLALIALSAEIAFRVIAGDKLLYRADPAIEYLPQPDQSVRQRGVDMRTNSWGMRSPAVAGEKPADVFRILIVGDSVVFGYVNISHDDLATARLSGRPLNDGLRLETLNVSASSWGPGNMLAWLDANGTFGADSAILVLSSHDLEDDRTFAPPDRDLPQSRPVLASIDWLLRQLPVDKSTTPGPRSPGDAARFLPLLMDRLAELPHGACVILHKTQEERQVSGPSAEAAQIAALAEARSIAVVEDFRFISVIDGYADSIHLSPKGQAQLADAMKSCPALADRLAD